MVLGKLTCMSVVFTGWEGRPISDVRAVNCKNLIFSSRFYFFLSFHFFLFPEGRHTIIYPIHGQHDMHTDRQTDRKTYRLPLKYCTATREIYVYLHDVLCTVLHKHTNKAAQQQQQQPHTHNCQYVQQKTTIYYLILLLLLSPIRTRKATTASSPFSTTLVILKEFLD